MTQLSDSQAQTSNIFGYKWRRRETYDTGGSVTANTRRWYLEKYFCGNEVKLMCHDSGLTTQRVHEDGSGITVVATKD